MIIKSFVERSSSAALKRVREQMGGEAIVLKTRQITGSGGRLSVEITACLENPTVEQSTLLLTSPVGTVIDSVFDDNRPDALAAALELAEQAGSAATATAVMDEEDTDVVPEDEYAETPRENKTNNRIAGIDKTSVEQRIERERRDGFYVIEQTLRDADFPKPFIQRLIEKANRSAKIGDDLTAVTRSILVEETACLMAPSMPFAPGDRVLFVGPAGAGKSSVVAKLAAQLIMLQKLPVSLITLDTVKMAAFDEIAGYGRILGADVVDVQSQDKDLYLNPDSITLIDSPALPGDPDRLERLVEQARSLDPTHVLAVYSALTRSSDIPHLARNAAVFEPTNVVVTMLDLTDLCGTAIAAAEASGCPIGFITESPSGIGEIKTPDPDRMIRNLLQVEAFLV
ncbi:MAG TPA: hypothetical protein PLF13_00745 [candidate division Zixibacteria bacterium]|nr:hypothetical protein [candidate division Zixibacteria bacterium]